MKILNFSKKYTDKGTLALMTEPLPTPEILEELRMRETGLSFTLHPESGFLLVEDAEKVSKAQIRNLQKTLKLIQRESDRKGLIEKHKRRRIHEEVAKRTGLKGK